MSNIIISGSEGKLGSAIAKKWCMSDKNRNYYGLSKWNNLDITDYEAVNSFLNDLGDLPVALINNAGVCIPGNILETTMKDIKEQFEVNFFAMVNLCKTYVDFCILNDIPGNIINIASTAGTGVRPDRFAYAASKAAVISFSLSLSESLKENNIKVYCISPEAFGSKMRFKICLDDDFENMLKADEVADFIISILDKDIPFLDGQNIIIRR